MSRIHSVIMAGGRGTRFWPASRDAMPKQFLSVAGTDSLLSRTGQRLYPLAGAEQVWVVTAEAHVGRCADHLPEIARDQIVGEPVGRNTAPCIALAAALVLKEDRDGVMLVAPADHWIGDENAFREAATYACDFANNNGGLVTFGIQPTAPETGYGYIEAGDDVDGRMRRVVRFTEKPDPQTAQEFLAGGRHFWNSGIFAWRADVFLEELKKHHPEMAAACRRVANATDRESAIAEAYPGLPSVSVDYAVLELSDKVHMMPATFPWSDVGSWDSLWGVLPKDKRRNALEGDAIAVDSDGCLVTSFTSRFTALVGLKDVCVVDTADALLVIHKDRAQDVKAVVEALEAKKRSDLL
ncbi:MAG: NTP transferase domain-containing protein [Gemmatimonadetes bacterium]|nr:NTP transferase domain-containing protein [Gemmatimonadota bacterium]